jgi:hypothetical protein
VRCVAPTLIQESGAGARTIEQKRAELAAVTARSPLGEEEVREIGAIGDNSGCMTLKGASVEYTGPPTADRWELNDELAGVGARWQIDPERDLREHEHSTVNR